MSAAFKKRMKLANGDAGALLESIGKKEEPKEEKPKKNEPIKPRGPAAALTEDQMVSFLLRARNDWLHSTACSCPSCSSPPVVSARRF